MQIQDEQFKVSLTNDPEVLSYLRHLRKLVRLPGSQFEAYETQYDSQPLAFKIDPSSGKRSVHPFGSDVAKAIIRSNLVVIGDPNADPRPVLVKVGEFSLSEGDPSGGGSTRGALLPLCPYCKKSQPTLEDLGDHIPVCARAASRIAPPQAPPPPREEYEDYEPGEAETESIVEPEPGR